MTREICANCRWWHLEVDALPDDLRDVAVNLSQGETDPIMSEYGKCKAEYMRKDGTIASYDSGSVGMTPCFAKDEGGNNLFSPVPED